MRTTFSAGLGAMNWFKEFWRRLTQPTPGVQNITTPSRTERPPGGEFHKNFTPRAQQVLALAGTEAKRLHHHFVGTEHVLLGILKLGQGTAYNVLTKMGLNSESVRQEVERQIGTGPVDVIVMDTPYTPRVKKAIALAQKEAKQLSHREVGSEHLLLGLLREDGGVAARVLANLGVRLEETRNEILRVLDGVNAKSSAGSATARKSNADDVFGDFLSSLTPRAAQVLRLAREEAKEFQRETVESEHVLLGLIRLGQGMACYVLSKAGLSLEVVRREAANFEAATSRRYAAEDIVFGDGVKAVVARAEQEARDLNHSYVGTEHLLLALLEVGGNVVAGILKNLGVNQKQMRNEILRELDPNLKQAETGESAVEAAIRRMEAWRSNLPKPDPLDITRRYDVYCVEHGQSVVYRNVLLKSVKGLFPGRGMGSWDHYIELEQSDGKSVFLPKASVFKFCDPGAAAEGERVA